MPRWPTGNTSAAHNEEMDLTHLIGHPEALNKETLFELRSLLARHPYYQPARLLLLQNLYLLHDPTFDEELRRAAVYLSDRRVLFDLVEAAHYELRPQEPKTQQAPAAHQPDRTMSLIDSFLESLPDEEPRKEKRKPTPADATVDYVAYLMQLDEADDTPDPEVPEMNGQALIDDFLTQKKGKIKLKEKPEYVPQLNDDKSADDGIFTETLALIYIKQGRYSKALEIIKRLNLNYPKKNAYFADQIRFLEKIIINNNYKN